MWKKSALILSGSASLTAFGCYFLNNNLVSADSVTPYVLEQVQVVVRHGARTPISTLSDDLTNIQEAHWKPEILGTTLKHTDVPHEIELLNGEVWSEESLLDKSYKKHGVLKGGMLKGQLTTVGQQQAYDLGKWLHEEYIKKHNLISTKYCTDEIKIRSSNVLRTLYTARCVASGLFGKENIDKPLNIITQYTENEDIYPNWGFCEKLRTWFKSIFADKDQAPGYKEDRIMIRELLGLSEGYKDPDMIAVLDLLHCRRTHGFYLPESILQHEEHIEKRAAFFQSYLLGGKEKTSGLRLSVGSFLNELCCTMEKTANGESTHKFNLYSCHDTTLIALQMALDNWECKWPYYASFFSFELYKDKADQRYVRVLFNGKELQVDKTSTDNIIPLDRFLSLVQKYRVEDWSKTCGNAIKDSKN